MAKNGKKQPSPFSIRFTEQERKSIEQAAGDSALLGGLPTIYSNPQQEAGKEHKLLAELIALLGQSRIASNINQLAKAVNSGSLPVNQDVLQSLEESVLPYAGCAKLWFALWDCKSRTVSLRSAKILKGSKRGGAMQMARAPVEHRTERACQSA